MARRKRVKHRCRWLYQFGRRAGAYRASRSRATQYCWQTGKNLRTKECLPCLTARLVECKSDILAAHDHKQPMKSVEWDKRHGKKD